MPSNTLFYYLQRVQREAGLTVSSAFPSTPTDEEQLVLDCINATLRELNNYYFLAFKQTEYTLTCTAGTSQYDLRQVPYNQTFWRVNRLAKNAVRRTADDYPLLYLDYADRDYLQPVKTGNSLPTHYSAFGEYLLLYPAPAGATQLTIRYYGRHIGTDSTGVTQKQRLTATGDLCMLEDDYEDALAYGSAAKVRRQQKVDEKYVELRRLWEEWRRVLVDVAQPGEEAYPSLSIASSSESYLQRKIGPFFNANF